MRPAEARNRPVDYNSPPADFDPSWRRPEAQAAQRRAGPMLKRGEHFHSEVKLHNSHFDRHTDIHPPDYPDTWVRQYQSKSVDVGGSRVDKTASTLYVRKK